MIRYNILKHSISKLPTCNILPVSSQDIKLMWVIWYVTRLNRSELYMSLAHQALFSTCPIPPIQQSFVRIFICHIYRKQVRLGATYLLCQGWDLAQCAQVWTSGIKTWPPQKFYHSLLKPRKINVDLRHFYHPHIRQKVRHSRFLESSIGLIHTTYSIVQIFLYSMIESNIGIIYAWEM